MRLQMKLVLAAMGVTFAMVLVLSMVFLGELLRQRIDQTVSGNEMLARQVLLMARQAIEVGLHDHPPADATAQALRSAAGEALGEHKPLADTMNAIVRYSPTVQDVSVTDAAGMTIVSTDPEAVGAAATARLSLKTVRDGNLAYQVRQMFGRPKVLDIALPLARNGSPFLVVHVGVRSTFLRAAYEPWFHAGLWSSLTAALFSMLAAALLASAALRPIQRISEQLERLSQPSGEEAMPGQGDAVVRVNRTIDRLGLKIRSTEAEYTALQANLNQMLDTLRDGVLLFTADRRAAMVSDAVAHFLPAGERGHEALVGKRLEEIFARGTRLGEAAVRIFESQSTVRTETVTLEDGRSIELTADRIRQGAGTAEVGTLLTLRDTESASRIEQELEVSRRLMAIGRLTAGVGHEVKNPINAMVLHLELLRSKLAKAGEPGRAAQRHVEILSSEMQRLDRVVQTLADFTRPIELHLAEHDLRHVVSSVVELTGTEMTENGVQVELAAPASPLLVSIDADLIRQAILNLLLNAMQAMPRGGTVRLVVSRTARTAMVEVIDAGHGIPPKLLPRIFDLYFTTKPSGTGIGLSMTYRILQMHGGTLEVRSSTSSDSVAAMQGTTFTLHLPISPSGRTELYGEAQVSASVMTSETEVGIRR